MDDKDFEALGFKCGLEIHQQLLTERKLFCRCPPVYRNDPAHFRIIRHMRPTLSEMGTYDGTALMEFKTRKNITYEFFRDTTCSYEIDDTPPFEMDEKALEISMVIARSMECALVDEVHVSRKQYLDGSIPTGFQRTAIISLGGYVPWKDGRKIEIRQISLEEDACREVSDKGHEVVFRTDRLSIPLVEVVTEPNAKNPTEAGEMAEVLGWVMRSTQLVRRGPGATRQDVNVSVEGGRRVEIKGVPFLEWIPPITAGEAVRQHNLLKIKSLLEDRNLDPDRMKIDEISNVKYADVTDIFQDRTLEIMNPWFDGPVKTGTGLDVKAVLIPGFREIFSHPTHGDQTFSDEVAGRLRVISCLDRMPNLHTSDDVPFGGITEKDMQKISEKLDAADGDAFVLVWGPERDTLSAVQEVHNRSREAFDGIPHETRQVITPEMTTFERILPGPDRMYPDTDRPPKVVTPEILRRVNEQVPASWWDRKKIMMDAGVPEHVAHRLVVSPRIEIHDMALEKGADRKFSAIFIMEELKHLQRKGMDVDSMDPEEIAEVLAMPARGIISTRAVPKILWVLSSGEKDPGTIVSDLGLTIMKEEELKEAVGDIIKDNQDLVTDFRDGRKDRLMGVVMDSIGDRAQGSKVHGIIRGLI
jgi:glutamyl-tRNA(Gln) amidotransferase subunit E